MSPSYSSIAALIDHTLLRPEATATQIRALCRETREHGFAGVCVNPYWVPLAASELDGARGVVCTVIGFPLGASSTSNKVAEASEAIGAGAREVDMVINIGELKGGDEAAVKDDIRAVCLAAHSRNAIVKVIIETALLEDGQKRTACLLAKDAGADFVKTSTGFAASGATEADVALMRSVVGPVMGVKASGGIRTLEDLKRMVAAGATRIGTSSGVAILKEASK